MNEIIDKVYENNGRKTQGYKKCLVRSNTLHICINDRKYQVENKSPDKVLARGNYSLGYSNLTARIYLCVETLVHLVI